MMAGWNIALATGCYTPEPMDDQHFEAWFERTYGPIVDHWFYSKVAGANHRNSDGTSRSRIIAQCGEFEALELVPEPDNPFDQHALAILRRPNGEQLGYVDARAASDIARDAGKDFKWIAILKEHNYHPETGKVVGANLVLARISGKLVLAQEAQRAAQGPPSEQEPEVCEEPEIYEVVSQASTSTGVQPVTQAGRKGIMYALGRILGRPFS
jgi:hypothetical protein